MFGHKIVLVAMLAIFALTPLITRADNVTLSIAPPLIKNNVNPGQMWRSAIKVVNNNATSIEVYTQVLDFKSGNNDNTVEFLPELSEQERAEKVRMSSWIVMDNEKITIPAFKSVDVSFVIDVPKTAEPGGHYAAILVGTTPPSGKINGSAIKVSSMLSSLILLSVAGDVKEQGRIREFSVDRDFYFDPKVNFKVKFENFGNVHIQPQGEIKVYDFFGKTKEVITLNHKSEFGNVLPGDTRSWDFFWQGSGSLTEMGRYKAQLVLSYGSKERETVDQTLFFWVIYLKPLLIIGGTLLFLILLIIFSIKFYIKRSIRAVQLASGISSNHNKVIKKTSVVAEEKDDKVINLKNSSLVMEDDEIMKNIKWSGFKKFMIFVLVMTLIAGSVMFYLYFWNKPSESINYNEIYQENNTIKQSDLADNNSGKSLVAVDSDVATTSVDNNNLIEQVASSTSETSVNIADTANIVATRSNETSLIEEIVPKANGELLIKVLNGGGVVGMAKKVVELIGAKKYTVAQVGNADNYNYETTLIRYKKGDGEFAEEIKSLVDRRAIVEESNNQEEDIVVIIGKSFAP